MTIAPARLATYEQSRSGTSLVVPAGLPEAPEWVETPTSKKILAGLRYAQLASDIVVIYGGAGLGKTHSIRQYQATSLNVFHAEMSPSTRGVLASLEEIALAVGLSNYGSRPAFMHRTICARLRNTGGLMVIDEAQELSVLALDQVRCIHDRARIGIALVGNERVYTQMTGSNRAAYLDRLYSRIGKRIHLKRSTDGDADSLIKAWGITDGTCRARLLEIASKPGALRVLNKTLRLAQTYARSDDRQVEHGDIDAAWHDLGGLD